MEVGSLTINVDDQSTWPPEVADYAAAQAGQLRGTTEHTSDLSILTDGPDPYDGEDDFRALLHGYRLVAYHATRLLDHEVEAVRREGLRPLTVNLVSERIAGAHEHGYLTSAQRDELEGAHVFADPGGPQRREDQVCLVLSRAVFDIDVRGVDTLLTTWGGEGIYMSEAGYLLRPLLRTLGRATIVVADLDLSPSWRVHYTAPDVRKVFVGAALGLADYGADVLYRAPVSAEHVHDIWQPGHPEYDRHEDLPRD